MCSEIEKKYRDMLLKLSGEERLKMGFSMHHLSKCLVLAAIRKEHPQASESKVRRELFLRFYGTDFEEPARTRAASAIAEYSHKQA